MHNIIEKEKKAHYAPQFNVFEEDSLSSFLVLYFMFSFSLPADFSCAEKSWFTIILRAFTFNS